jgi:hypothetical protein
VTLGVVDITNGPHAWTTLVEPEDIIIHENYSANNDFAVNDLALLRIRKTMLLGSRKKILKISMKIIFATHRNNSSPPPPLD